ncbi:MAG: hypothetical protein DI527_02105 [Chelatococcus sp.]|nr:MAG: hypothetical protein DI527_02105 [Chelatococcus sp.]
MTTMQAVALAEALGTLKDVAGGLLCQPRFNDLHYPNAAGDVLSRLQDEIAAMADEAMRLAAISQPHDRYDRLFWAEAMIRDAASRAERVEDIAEFAQSLVTRRS